jgi:hypothetical protein
MYTVNDSEDSQCPCRIPLAILSFKLDEPRFAFRYGQDLFSLRQIVQTGFVVHPAPYLLDTGNLFSGGKAARVWI